MKLYKKITSIFVLIMLLTTSFFTNIVQAKDKNVSFNEFTINASNFKVTDNGTTVKVDVFVDGILDHTSIVERKTGKITEKKNGKETIKNISEFVKSEKIKTTKESLNLNDISRYHPVGDGNSHPGFYYITDWSNHGYRGLLWGKDYVVEGPAKHLSFSKGTVKGTVVGILVGLIPGINAVEVIAGLGGRISGAVLGSYIHGDIWAIDHYLE